MTTKKLADSESPSTSSAFLPQLRRSRRGSIVSLSSTSQIGKEALAETLDQIHSTASQSDTLTTFNEYTSPPSSSAGIEGKGITSELQGGLSGLYSRLRASVGNVKDIVTTFGDDNNEDDVSTKSPRFAASSPVPIRQRPEGIKSSNGSLFSGRDETSVTGARQVSQDRASTEATVHERAVKQRPTNLSASSASVASRGSSATNIGLRSPVTLPVVAAAASPAVAEVNVNAVKEKGLTDESIDRVQKDTNSPLRTSTESHTDEVKTLSTTTQQNAAYLESRSGHTAEVDPSPLIGSKLVISRLGSPATAQTSDKSADHQQDLLVSQGLASVISQETPRQSTLIGSHINEAYGASQEPSSSALRDFVSHKTKEVAADEITTLTGTGKTARYSESTPGKVKARTYKHAEVPVLKPMAAQIKSRSHAPDVSLTPASSDATATTLISTTQYQVPFREQSYGNSQDHMRLAHPRGVRSMTANMPQVKSKVLNREYWMRDENAKDCFYCGDPFSTFRRKHHCSKSHSLKLVVHCMALTES